jgi:hypothetical protein
MDTTYLSKYKSVIFESIMGNILLYEHGKELN